jgi:hypothetical protein
MSVGLARASTTLYCVRMVWTATLAPVQQVGLETTVPPTSTRCANSFIFCAAFCTGLLSCLRGMVFRLQCASAPCQHDARCTDRMYGYSCACEVGWSGKNCSDDIDECGVLPCQHGAACFDGVAQFTCSCLAGFEGNSCETNIDDCASNPCANGGACVDVDVGAYSCACKSMPVRVCL